MTRSWGPWTLNPDNYTLVHPSTYYVDLPSCVSSAEVLDWIGQIAQKTWADEATVAGLVWALDDILHLQGNLCPGGIDRRMTMAEIQHLVDDWVAPSL